GRLLRDQSVRALVQRGDRERAGRNGCDGDRSVSRPDRLRLSGRREAGGIEARRGQNAPVLARGRAGRIRRVDARHARVRAGPDQQSHRAASACVSAQRHHEGRAERPGAAAVESPRMNHGEIVSFFWGVADLIRDTFKRGKYQDVILPLTVLRRLDCVLAPTKAKVLAKQAELKGKKLENLDAQLRKASGFAFYNTSRYDFDKLLSDAPHLAAN